MIENGTRADTVRRRIVDKGDLPSNEANYIFVSTGTSTTENGVEVPNTKVGNIIDIVNSDDKIVQRAANATNATNATNSTNATNVTNQINGKEIKNIFEDDGITVKTAKEATNASFAVNIYNDIKEEYSSLSLALLNLVYPIGSIYITMEENNPANFLGGTWERFAAGRTLVGVGDDPDIPGFNFNKPGLLGGEAKHTLTIEEMPNHDHAQRVNNQEVARMPSDEATGIKGNVFVTENRDIKRQSSAILTISNGGGVAHNNLQPYITVNMWKRIK